MKTTSNTTSNKEEQTHKEITIKIWNKIASYLVVANSTEANIIYQQSTGERHKRLTEQRKKIQTKVDLLYKKASMVNE